MENRNGFSLLELIWVMAILTVFAGVGIATFLGGLPDRRILAASREIYAGIQRARSEAVQRNENVTISFTTRSYQIFEADSGREITRYRVPDNLKVEVYDITGDNGKSYTYTPRGTKILPSVNGIVRLRYYRPFGLNRGVRVTSTGGISLIDETDSNW